MRTSDRLDLHIVLALKYGKPGFNFLGTYWDLHKDKKHLQEALDISLKQMWGKMYYGMFNMETIEKAKMDLDRWRPISSMVA